MAVQFTPKATSTVKFTPKPTVMPKQDGLLNSIAKDIALPFARLGVNAMRAGQILTPGGVTAKDIRQDPGKAVNMPWLGAVKPVGQEGSFGNKLKDSLGVGLEVASTLVPVGGGAATVGKLALKGKILRGAVTGAAAGGFGGSLYGAGREMQSEDSTLGSVATQGAIGGVLGTAGGAVLGGLLPIPAAGIQKMKPNKIMDRVAGLGVQDRLKFKERAGKTAGEYLVERGIYGNDEEITQQLAKRWIDSRNVADGALAELDKFGTFRSRPVQTALEALAEREARISVPGVASKDTTLVNTLLNKYKREGLTMSEINQVKRLFERNIKVNYAKEAARSGASEKIVQATNIDDAVRTWQFETAKKLGLQNLPDVNKETALAKQLLDAFGKRLARDEAKSGVSLTDWIVLSNFDPTSVSAFIAKRFFGNRGVQSSIARKFGGKATVGIPRSLIQESAFPRLPAGPIGGPNVTGGLPINLGAMSATARDIAERANPNIKKPNVLPRRSPKTEFPRRPFGKGAIPQIATEGQAVPQTQQASKRIVPTALPSTQPQNVLIRNAGKALKPKGDNYAGAVAGFEKDENGNVTFNPEKAALGMIVGIGAMRANKALIDKMSRSKYGTSYLSLDSDRKRVIDGLIEKAQTAPVKKVGTPEPIKVYRGRDPQYGPTETPNSATGAWYFSESKSVAGDFGGGVDNVGEFLIQPEKVAQYADRFELIEDYIAKEMPEREAEFTKFFNNYQGMEEEAFLEFIGKKAKGVSNPYDDADKVLIPFVKKQGYDAIHFNDQTLGAGEYVIFDKSKFKPTANTPPKAPTIAQVESKPTKAVDVPNPASRALTKEQVAEVLKTTPKDSTELAQYKTNTNRLSALYKKMEGVYDSQMRGGFLQDDGTFVRASKEELMEDALTKWSDEVDSVFTPVELEIARRWDLESRLEKLGIVKKGTTYDELPEYIKIYRGEGGEYVPGKEPTNFSLNKKVSERFGDTLNEFEIHKKDIPISHNNWYLQESELILENPANVLRTSLSDVPNQGKKTFTERLREGVSAQDTEALTNDARTLSYEDFVKKYEAYNLDRGGMSDGSKPAHAVVPKDRLFPTEHDSWKEMGVTTSAEEFKRTGKMKEPDRQRAVDEVNKYNKEEFNPPVVEEIDGDYFVIDGHHRVWNLLFDGVGDIPVYYDSRTLQRMWEKANGTKVPAEERKRIYDAFPLPTNKK